MCVSCNLSVSKGDLLSVCYHKRVYPDRILIRRLWRGVCMVKAIARSAPLRPWRPFLGSTGQLRYEAHTEHLYILQVVTEMTGRPLVIIYVSTSHIRPAVR